jgi:hypothetical protein
MPAHDSDGVVSAPDHTDSRINARRWHGANALGRCDPALVRL